MLSLLGNSLELMPTFQGGVVTFFQKERYRRNKEEVKASEFRCVVFSALLPQDMDFCRGAELACPLDIYSRMKHNNYY